LFLILFISLLIIKLSGGAIVKIPFAKLMISLLVYIFVPLILGYFTRRIIISKKGPKGFMEIKKYFPGISAIGILIIIFFSVTKAAKIVIENPIIFLLVLVSLSIYYLTQTSLSFLVAK